MLTVHLHENENKKGHYLVEEDGLVFKPHKQGTGIMPQYARELLKRGVAPETELNALRDRTPCFKSGITIGIWAKVSVSELGVPKFIPYEPMPDSVLKNKRLGT